MKKRMFLFLLLLLQSSVAFAEADIDAADIELVKATQNPLKKNPYTKYISLPFENDTSFGYGPNNLQTVLNFKPVIPFRLTQSYDLIVRTIAPILERTPRQNSKSVPNGSYINGWGDINPTFFISPDRFSTVLWGIGPTLFIPTSTNSQSIGSGKWSVGPELALVIMPGDWVFSLLTSNIWSIAGDPNRSRVRQFSFAYNITYNLKKGWYVTTNPTIAANWKMPGNQQWTVPFGGGFGRAFQFGKQPMSFSMQAYYNAIRPSRIGPNWQLQLSLEFLLPTT